MAEQEADVADRASDPLEGWDEGHGQVIDLYDLPTTPGDLPDGPLLAVAALVGAVAGVLLGRRGRWLAVGALVGLVAAAARRRLWELNP